MIPRSFLLQLSGWWWATRSVRLVVGNTLSASVATGDCRFTSEIDYQAPGSKCPQKPCADLGGKGSSNGYDAADQQACCDLCDAYHGDGAPCHFGVFNSDQKKCYLKDSSAKPKKGREIDHGCELSKYADGGGILTSGDGSLGLLPLLGLLGLVALLYCGAGMAVGSKGRDGGLLTRHPHYQTWLSVGGLVRDGVHFARGGRSACSPGRVPEGSAPSAFPERFHTAGAEPLLRDQAPAVRKKTREGKGGGRKRNGGGEKSKNNTSRMAAQRAQLPTGEDSLPAVAAVAAPPPVVAAAAAEPTREWAPTRTGFLAIGARETGVKLQL